MSGEGCRLIDRATGQPPAAVDEIWEQGELDVTGRITAVGSDADFSAARDDAVRRATLKLAEKYACEGKKCDDADGFCMLSAKVLGNRSGRLVTREVDVPESPYGGPAHKETRSYITYEVKVTATCRCAQRPAFIIPGSGTSQQYSPQLKAVMDFFKIFRPLPFPFLLAVGGPEAAERSQLEDHHATRDDLG